MDHLIRLIEALSGADDQPAAAVLFLPTGADWDLETPCAILVIDPDGGDEVPPPLARRYGLGATLSIPQLQDILANTRQQVATVTPEQLFAAFRFYYDHDAFIAFAGDPDA